MPAKPAQKNKTKMKTLINKFNVTVLGFCLDRRQVHTGMLS